jgi:hypothetical protein
MQCTLHLQSEINRILRPLFGLESVIKLDVPIDKHNGIVVVACIHDIFIATKGSREKHNRQVLNVSHIIMDNHMWIEIDKDVIDVTETTFLGCVVSRSVFQMDPEKAKAIIDWPRSTSR